MIHLIFVRSILPLLFISLLNYHHICFAVRVFEGKFYDVIYFPVEKDQWY